VRLDSLICDPSGQIFALDAHNASPESRVRIFDPIWGLFCVISSHSIV